MNATRPTDVTFKSEFGMTITVPADQATVFAMTRADQLRTLSRLIHDAAAGCDIQISDNDVFALSGLANELAITNARMTAMLADVADNDADCKEGGAA
jgi:hypothetical protein